MTASPKYSPEFEMGAPPPAISGTKQLNKIEFLESQTDAFILSLLNGECTHWPSVVSAPEAKCLTERTDFHGVAGLLASALEGVSNVPDDVSRALTDRSLSQLFWEDRHRYFIGPAIDALNQAKIDHVVLKGTATAYSVYETAAHRSRGDTDILIEPTQRIRAEEILLELGFERSLTFARSRGASQIGYSRIEANGWSHDIDLHWQINNSAFLSQLFSVEEVFSRSIPLKALCDTARAPSHVDSLLITCFHRLVHLKAPYIVNGTRHYSSERLIWLKDIELLSQKLTPSDWMDFTARAHEKDLSNICLSGLTAASEAFGFKAPKNVLQKLTEPAEISPVETYLYGTSATRFRLNIGAQPGAWGKIAYIGEHLFPPKAYMREQFGDGSLAMLYIRRGIQGAGKWFSGGLEKP